MELQMNKETTRAERLRQAILKRAFEGNLVPQEPNDEPADALLRRIRSEMDEKPQSKSQKLGKGGTVHEQCSLLPHD
jgi:type I restriction enzyme S subunit